MKKNRIIFLLCALVSMWGLAYPINKIGLSYTSPTHFIEWRLFISTITMFIIAAATKNLIIPHLKDLPMILAVGLFQIAITLNLTNFGISLVGAGKATFLVFATSIWIIPFSIFLTKRMIWLDVLSFFIGAIGVLIVINPWKIDWHNHNIWIGDITLLLASIFWSIGILCARFMKWHRSSLQLLPWQLLLASLCTAILAYCEGLSFFPQSSDPIFISALLYTGILSTAIGYWAMLIVSKELSPAIVSLGLVFVPIVSLIISLLFLHEEISSTLIVGVSFIILGSLFHIYSERKSKKILQLFEKL